MGPLGIVIIDPGRQLFASVVEPEEQAFVQKLVAHAAIEGFDIAILPWASGLDEQRLRANLGEPVPKNLPVSGIEQTKKLLDPAIPSNGMMKNWKYQSG